MTAAVVSVAARRSRGAKRTNVEAITTGPTQGWCVACPARFAGDGIMKKMSAHTQNTRHQTHAVMITTLRWVADPSGPKSKRPKQTEIDQPADVPQ